MKQLRKKIAIALMAGAVAFTPLAAPVAEAVRLALRFLRLAGNLLGGLIGRRRFLLGRRHRGLQPPVGAEGKKLVYLEPGNLKPHFPLGGGRAGNGGQRGAERELSDAPAEGRISDGL